MLTSFSLEKSVELDSKLEFTKDYQRLLKRGEQYSRICPN